MSLRRLQVSDFRCLKSAELELDPEFTLISGPNASGKTSVLEALYLLGRGRSFRTRRLDNLIRAGAERFVVFGEIQSDERRVPIGIEGTRAGIRARLSGKDAPLAELAGVLPIQIIDPEIHRLIEEGPSRRRRFLDWGVFHVEHSFIHQWQRYQQVLKQRNAALRLRQPRAVVEAWNDDLVRQGEFIDSARRRYVVQLTDAARGIAEALLGMELALSYRPGWPKDASFGEALAAHWSHDQEAGSTLLGPQRAEVAIRLDGLAVRDRISRGQQKLLAASLIMAQLSVFSSQSSARPTLLLDDPAAELDSDRLLGLIREVTQQSLQLIVTSLNPHFQAFGAPRRRYIIQAGSLSAAPLLDG